MREKDLNNLWEKEGCRNLLNSFFSNPQLDTAQKERIKGLALEKLAAENGAEKVGAAEVQAAKTWKSRLYKKTKTLWWRWHWKLSIPLVALTLMVIIGARILPLYFEQNGVFLNNGLSEKTAGTAGERQNALSDEQPATNEAAPSAASGEKSGIMLDNSDVSAYMPPDTTTPPADSSLAKMITYNLNATIQVNNIAATINKLNQDVQQMGGYVVNSQQYIKEASEYGHFTAKIPADKYESFRISLSGIGKIISQTQTADDITNQYYDAQTRLQNWEAEQLRYTEILKQAQTVEDVLKIESYLANIRQQIEQLKGQLRYWNNAVQFSTVQIELQPATTPILQVTDPWQPVSWLKTWKAVQAAMLKTISTTWNVLNYVIVGLSYVFPYLILFGIIYLAYRLINNKRAKKQEKN
ncbi:MAG TPA: DUF4349 domain-containing protein [Desulfitobacteriaceae bacterium]|nr:DUF4349 domain-containing protein [Desulfitobacteriaceae bacterium]